MSIVFNANFAKFCSVKYFSSCRMNASKCCVAICQFTATNNKENNLKIVKDLVAEAAQKHAKVVFLPEASDYIATNKEEAKALAEPLSGTLMNEYRNLAKNKKVWLSVGGFHELVQCEKECYDLRFPELSILQRKQGANILTYPSAFTNATGLLHWETLLRARAVETQCYVIAAAQYGKHNQKRISFGQALIVDPQGKIVAECPKYREGHDTNQSVAIAEIDSDLIKKIRCEMPVFQHRRDDLYRLQTVGNEEIAIDDSENFMFAHKVIPGSTVFYRTRHSFAFTNIRCVVPYHVLISSIRSCKRLSDLTDEEVADLFQTAVKVQQVVEAVTTACSSTLCVQDGTHAGQTIPHVHIHILPRHPNDFDHNDEVYDKLAKHDRDNNPEPRRSDEEMSKEAKILRKYFYKD